MDKILAYLLDNLKQLTPFHLLLVLLLAILSSAAMFFVFRWLYTSRLDAQKELLGMKAEQVSELKARFAELKEEGVQLSRELAQANGNLATSQSHAATVAELSMARVRLVIIALMWFHTMQNYRVSLWSILAIYAELELPFRSRLTSAPPAELLRERLDHITEPFRSVDLSPDAFARFEPTIRGEVSAPYPSGLIEFPFAETAEALEALRREMDSWLDALFHAMETELISSS
jgi:hypothetical protein